jgi:hypothetical protein
MPRNQPYAPLLLVESFPKNPRTRSQASRFCGSHNYKKNKTTLLYSYIDHHITSFEETRHICGSHNYKTKQNYPSFFIHRSSYHKFWETRHKQSVVDEMERFWHLVCANLAPFKVSLFFFFNALYILLN